MIESLSSNVVIRCVLTIGLVAQLLGVVLVVRDLMTRHGAARRFTKNINMIEKVHRELQDDSENEALEAANGDEIYAAMIRPNVEIGFRASKAEMATHHVVTYLLAEVQVPTRWKSWVGPILLLLGIVLAYAGAMLSIR